MLKQVDKEIFCQRFFVIGGLASTYCLFIDANLTDYTGPDGKRHILFGEVSANSVGETKIPSPDKIPLYLFATGMSAIIMSYPIICSFSFDYELRKL